MSQVNVQVVAGGETEGKDEHDLEVGAEYPRHPAVAEEGVEGHQHHLHQSINIY